MLIGSKALIHHGIQLERKCADFDFIVRPEAYEKIKSDFGSKVILEKDNRFGKTLFVSGHKPLEYEIAETGTTGGQLLDIIGEQEVAPLDVLYTLKMSHRYLKSPHFHKTRKDILKMREHSAKIPESLAAWYKARIKETYNYSHPKLNTTREGFFRDDFIYYDHDDLHRAIMKYDRPAFDFIKVDAAEVQCSKQKFLDASEEIKLLTVYEECAVLSLERHQIPCSFTPKPEESFRIALMKVCSSITSGWFREWAWEAHDRVLEYYYQHPTEYVEKFKSALAEGQIGLWKGEESSMAQFEKK